MKICPTCNQTYTDETLNFCLADGAVLNVVNQDNASAPTLFMGQPPLTSQNPTVVQTNPNYNQGNVAVNRQTPNYSSQQPTSKKSRTWIWIVGILGGLVLLVGIGFIGLIGLVVSNIPDEPTENNSSTSPTPVVAFDSILTDDFSKWQVEHNDIGNTDFENGEFVMSSKQVGYYYVLLTADKDYKTSNATTKIVARNVTGKEARSGYGLVVHSDPLKPLVKDYAFLIDASKQSYRVVQHTPKKETELVSWTRFPAIRSGTQTNEIEVKDQNGKMSLFINSQFAVAVNDNVGFKDGVFGLYVSDTVPIAFSKLQVAK